MIELSKLSLREKIGQTSMLTEDRLLSSSIDFEKYIQNYPLGFMWCGNWREKYKRAINADIKIPMVLVRDSECGIDNAMCNMAALGATRSKELAFQHGVINGRKLRTHNVRWQWGPVVDLYVKNDMTGRLMSDDAKVNASLTPEIIKGSQSVGVAACAKHFPSHSTNKNPHYTRAINKKSFQEWSNEEGRVFQAAIDAGVYSIMIDHTAFPAVDDTWIENGYIPASISYKIITGLLKEQMGFEGVVVSDDVIMRGASNVYSQEEVYINMLNAGIDVVLEARNFHYVDVIEQAVRDGKIKESRIDDACGRVLKMKEKLGLFSKQPPLKYTSDECDDDIYRFNRILSQKALTLVKDEKHLLPLSPKKIKIVSIICFSNNDNVVNYIEPIKNEFEVHGAKVHIQRGVALCKSFTMIDNGKTKHIPMNYDDEDTQILSVEEMDKNSDLIIYITYLDKSTVLNERELNAFFGVMTSGREKSALITLGSATAYEDYFSEINLVIHTYLFAGAGFTEEVVKGMYGEFPFTGNGLINYKNVSKLI